MKRRDPETARRLGAVLARWKRETPGLTFVRMSQIMGISSQQFQKYKKGVDVVPLHRLQRLADAIGKSLRDAFPRRLSLGIPARAAELGAPYGIRHIPLVNRVKCSFEELWLAGEQYFGQEWIEAWIPTTDVADPHAFALVACGPSMTGAGIAPGDRLIVSPSAEVRSGDIAIVLFLNTQEATVKYVRFSERGHVLELLSDDGTKERRTVDISKEPVKLYKVLWQMRQPGRRTYE